MKALWLFAGCLAAWAQSAAPQFEDYPVKEMFSGTPAAPILTTPDQRMYRTRIRRGVSDPLNFAGHYFAIRWGCGSQCGMMAIVDAETGKVYEPPMARDKSLWVPLDNLSDMQIDYRPDSSLLILRNACRDFRDRRTCGLYYFNWKDNRFTLVKFVMVDPLKDLK